MKNIKYWLLSCCLLIVIACSKQSNVESVLGDPDERIADTLAYLKKSLVDSKFGWKASITTEYAGAYSFFILFDNNDRLKMVGDLDNQSASEVKESTYRVRQIMSATLSFDTYNYITLLQDPDPSSFGGLAGRGLGSDIEFDYIKSHGDTIFLEGRKFHQPLVLVKATEGEYTQYLNGDLAKSISKTDDFFEKNSNAYIEVDDVKYQITLDNYSKFIGADGVLPGNIVESSLSKYNYSLEGISVFDTTYLKVGSKNISEIKWIDSKLFAIDSDGTKYEFNNSQEPLMPLHLLVGVKYPFMYIPFSNSLPGTTPDGKIITNRFFDNLANRTTGFVFNCGELNLRWNSVNKRLTLGGFSSQNNCNSGWTTNIVYDYEIDNLTGVVKLTKRSEASGGYTQVILDKIDEFFVNSSFKLEYFVDGKDVYGKLKGIEKPEVEITFRLN
ncbi:MAG: DUF4302 domain-containing protein [Sphingobacterium composti]